MSSTSSIGSYIYIHKWNQSIVRSPHIWTRLPVTNNVQLNWFFKKKIKINKCITFTFYITLIHFIKLVSLTLLCHEVIAIRCTCWFCFEKWRIKTTVWWQKSYYILLWCMHRHECLIPLLLAIHFFFFSLSLYPFGRWLKKWCEYELYRYNPLNMLTRTTFFHVILFVTVACFFMSLKIQENPQVMFPSFYAMCKYK